MKSWRQLLIPPTASIREAISRIDAGNAQIVLVADENGTLMGTITDGDVRRGMLRGCALDDASSRIMNSRPQTAHVNESREAILRIMRDKQIHQIPLV